MTTPTPSLSVRTAIAAFRACAQTFVQDVKQDVDSLSMRSTKAAVCAPVRPELISNLLHLIVLHNQPERCQLRRQQLARVPPGVRGVWPQRACAKTKPTGVNGQGWLAESARDHDEGRDG